MLLTEEIAKRYGETEKLLTKDDVKSMVKCDYSSLNLYHFGLGIRIRNMLSIDHALRGLFVEYGFSDLDDMSNLIVTLFWLHIKERYLNNKIRNP